MSNTISINATKREELGSANARRIRRAGQIPAVVYGHGQEASTITITPEDANKISGHNGLVEINCSCGAKKMVVVKEVQRHPLIAGIFHVDFLEVAMDEIITSVVPVVSEGEAAGTRQGGQLEQVIMELEIKSLPANVPDSITVDVSNLEMGQAIHVKDLVLPEGVTPTVDESLIVFHVRAPKTEAAEEEAAPAEGEAAPAEGEAAKA